MYGLGNIIQNAIEHAKRKINVNISWNMNNIFISIKDDGEGFPNEILEKIDFKKFNLKYLKYTTQAGGKLALKTAKKIISDYKKLKLVQKQSRIALIYFLVTSM